MAYSTTAPAYLLVPKVAGGGGSIWGYSSTDSIAQQAAAGFVSNGAALGMKIGDVFFGTSISTAGAYIAHSHGRVSAVTASSAATIVFASSST